MQNIRRSSSVCANVTAAAVVGLAACSGNGAAPAPVTSVAVPPAPRAAGMLHADAFRAELSSRSSAIASCYNRALARDPELRGELTVLLVIDIQGEVSVTVEEDSEALAAAGVTACAVEELRRMDFATNPPEGEDFRVRQSMGFHPPTDTVEEPTLPPADDGSGGIACSVALRDPGGVADPEGTTIRLRTTRAVGDRQHVLRLARERACAEAGIAPELCTEELFFLEMDRCDGDPQRDGSSRSPLP